MKFRKARSIHDKELSEEEKKELIFSIIHQGKELFTQEQLFSFYKIFYKIGLGHKVINQIEDSDILYKIITDIEIPLNIEQSNLLSDIKLTPNDNRLAMLDENGKCPICEKKLSMNSLNSFL